MVRQNCKCLNKRNSKYSSNLIFKTAVLKRKKVNKKDVKIIKQEVELFEDEGIRGQCVEIA